RRSEGGYDVDVSAAGLELRLPSSPPMGRARHAPQALEPHPDVVILQPVEQVVRHEVTSGNVAVNVVLKDAVIASTAFRIVVSTEPARPLRRAADGSLEGEIRLEQGGELQLLGKTFRIDRGLVRLRTVEPDNPYVNVTARWEAPDGTTVFVDHAGNIKELDRNRLRFRSSPPLGEDAILGLILFGDTGDFQATAGVDAERRARQALGGVLAGELSQLFGDLLPGLSAGLGTTADGLTTTAVGYRFSDRISAQAILEQVPGTGAFGALGSSTGSGGTPTTPGVAGGDARAKLGVDFRLGERWLVRGTLGVSGGAASGADLLYQYRY
ncbi:MAG: translocation/assembly module TamB domain-containing protein, partial [Deltaproteobacteria bacterium]|nr:translocation/assembly module TamB domain-containing protein [Deltaproteobacteria bacterium]